MKILSEYACSSGPLDSEQMALLPEESHLLSLAVTFRKFGCHEDKESDLDMALPNEVLEHEANLLESSKIHAGLLCASRVSRGRRR